MILQVTDIYVNYDKRINRNKKANNCDNMINDKNQYLYIKRIKKFNML